VQQIADAVGYSKPGLLRRFPSKQHLYDTTVTATREMVEKLLAQAPLVDEAHRRELFLRALVDTCLAHRGKVKLILGALERPADLPGAESLTELGLAVIRELSLNAPDQISRIRAVLAVQLVANVVQLSSDLTLPAELHLSSRQYHDLAFELAVGVLGR